MAERNRDEYVVVGGKDDNERKNERYRDDAGGGE